MLIRLLLLSFTSLATATAYTHLEPRQTHPVRLTPDGSKLLVLHSTAHSLVVFDVGSPPRSTPLRIAEIPVSTAPVSVNARTNDEFWVVNEGADSVSVVSFSRGAVIDTLRVADEPADVCFANGRAFVSCARKRVIAVFDAASRLPLGEISIHGLSPRALAANSDGSRLYVACLLSGNRTTILHQDAAPAQPTPARPNLPAPPKTGLILPADDPRVSWNVLDHDIAEIDTSSLVVERWFSGVGTHLFDLAFHPDGSLWCANSDALNLTRFEPELNGRFAIHRLTRLHLPDASISHHDLNPGIPRATVPEPRSIELALAQPTSVVFRQDGQRAWLAAFQSDRIAEIDTPTGTILRRIDVRPPGTGSESMRGPRGLALGPSRLYVVGKISDTLTTIDPQDGTVLSEIPIGTIDPMPANIRAGRGVLHDARLSGNGTLSCATCHIDADSDGLAWDLGNPGGEMISIPSADLSIHDPTVYLRDLHPMKGPLMTQTLRGLASNAADAIDPSDGSTLPATAITTKFHWRGDKLSIQSFNSTFPNLMGGSLQPAASMNHLAEYLLSIVHHPNPNLNLDRSLRADLPEGDATKGRTLFLDHSRSHCTSCHSLPGGTNQNLDLPGEAGKFQPIKNPSLRTVYQRAGIFLPNPGADSLSGFGLGSDGSGSVLPIVHPYSLSLINRPPLTPAKTTALRDLTAFLLSFDTATAPSACHDLTLTPSNRGEPDRLRQLETLETRATAGDNGVVAWGRVANTVRRFRWQPSSARYETDDPPQSLARNELLSQLAGNDALTFSGVLPEETAWRSTDRNSNGLADSNENQPTLQFQRDGTALYLRWPDGAWFPEYSPALSPPWQPAPGNPIPDGSWWKLPVPSESQPSGFYRLRRTW